MAHNFREYVCAERGSGPARHPNLREQTHPARVCLAAYREKPGTFTHHREANPRFTVHLVMHNGLQGVLVCRREFAIRGKNAFSVGFNADWPPVCGGQYRMTRWCVGQGSLLNYWDYLFCRSMLLTNFRVFPGIFFMCRRHNQPPRSLW